MGAVPTAESPIVEGFQRRVVDRGDDEALWSRGEADGECRRLSFAQLGERVEAWRRRLRTEAPLSGDRLVALAVGNVAAFVELYLALRRLGIPVLAVDGALGLAEQLHICRRLGASHLLTRQPGEEASGGSEPVDVFRDRAGGVRFFRIAETRSAPGDGDGDGDGDDDGDGVTPPPLPSGTGLVKMTSGSTGEPAGACFTDAGLEVGIRQIAAGMGIREEDRVLLAIPLSHSYGFDNGVLSLAVLGTPLVVERRIFPAELLRSLAETRATFLPLVPPLVRSLGQSPWPEGLALRMVICAGGRLLPSAARDFLHASGRPVHNFYGSTETGGISFESDPEDPAAAGTVGRPLPGVEVVLDEAGGVTVHSAANLVAHLGDGPPADEADDEEDVSVAPEPRSEPRSEARAQPRAQARAQPRVQPRAQPVVTGDRAEWRPDGRLRLVGRNAEILKIGGRRIAAAEMEAALDAVDGVREAAVVGVEDAVRGERSVAFVVADRWPLDLSSLRPRLAPREVRRVESLPHTARGKLDRSALRLLARNGGSAR